MADNFELGFKVDTTSVAAAKPVLEQTAAAAAKLGDAETKLATDTKKVTDAVKEKTAAVEKATAATPKMADALGKVSEAAKVAQGGLDRLVGAVSGGGFGGGGGGLAGALGSAGEFAGRFGMALPAVGIAAVAAAASVAALAGGYYKLQETLAPLEDKYALLEGRLKNVLGTTTQARDALAALRKSTDETGLGFNSASDAFLRFARSNETIGESTARLVQFATVIQKVGVLSGSSLGETQSAMMQFGQALGSGRLQGDELRSISENMPMLLQIIADGLGKSRGEIRALGSTGELTAEKLFSSIIKGAAKVEEEFKNVPDTLERANQRVSDQWERLLTNLGRQLEASAFMRGIKNTTAGLYKMGADALAPTEPMDAARSNYANSVRDLLITPDQQRMAGRVAPNAAQTAYATLADPKAGTDAKMAAQTAIEAMVEARIAALDPNSPLAKKYSDAKRKFELESEKRTADEAAGIGSEYNAASRAKIARVQSLVQEYDDFENKAKKLAEAKKDVGTALEEISRILNDPFASESMKAYANSNYETLTRIYGQIETGASKAKTSLQKAADDLKDGWNSFLLGGGGGGTAAIDEARKLFTQAEGQQGKGNAGNLDAYIGTVAGTRTLDMTKQTEEMQKQIGQQEEMNAAVRRGKVAVDEVRIAQRLVNEEFKLLGGPDSPLRAFPELVKAVKEYLEALGIELKTKNEEARNSAALAAQQRLAMTQAQIGTVGQGGYAERLARAQVEAEHANTSGGSGEDVNNQFYADETLRTMREIAMLQRQVASSEAMVGMNPRQRREATLNESIRKAREEANSTEGEDKVEGLMRKDAAAKEAMQYGDQERNLKNQISLIQERNKFVFETSEEYRVQEAMLRRRNELEMEGAPQEVVDRQVAVTEEVERQTIAYEKQRKRVEDLFSIIDNAKDTFKEGMISSFQDAFKTGQFNAQNFFAMFSNMVSRAGAELVYEISVRPWVEFATNQAKALAASGAKGLGGWLGEFFGGGGGSVTVTTPGGASGGVAPTANGNAFDHGGVTPFANGGIVNSPTMFAFANGGRLGVMGEAGPEAIMPLRRGSDGRLGVAGGGSGGVTVVVNDMRTSEKAQPVETSSSTGPDGRRVIALLIRDEVRKQVREGGLDRDLQTAYGIGRPVARL